MTSSQRVCRQRPFGRSALIGIALVTVGAPSVPGAASRTVTAPREARIAYEGCSRTDRSHWCGSDLYVISLTGGRRRRLTHSRAADDHDPVWSPDGTTIAFWREPERAGSAAAGVYLIRPDGSGERQLIRGAAHPSWSPGGRQIAFGKNGIFVIGIDGRGLRRIARRGGQPAWSPGGREIAFAKFNGRYTEIDVVAADGSGERRLTRPGRAGSEPRWLPDGQAIAFDWYDGVAVVDAASGRPLPDRFPRNLFSVSPAWSADGKEVAFTASRSVFFDLYVMRADGSRLRRITHTKTDEFTPAWSP